MLNGIWKFSVNIFEKEMKNHLSFASIESQQMKSVDVDLSKKNDDEYGKLRHSINVQMHSLINFEWNQIAFSVQQNLECGQECRLE